MKTKLLFIACFISVISFAQNILELNPANFPVTTPCGFTNFNNKLFYIGANATYGRELWSTDGTLSGNQLVKDIGYEYNISQVSAFQDQTGEATFGKSYVFNGKLYFNANDQYAQGNFRVWTTDGTQNGTTSFDPNVTKIFNMRYFQEFQGRLYFSAYNNVSGTEVWSTDGTLSGTILLKDINPNIANSINYDPSFTVMNNKMYFKADDGVHGVELWSTDGTAAGTNMVLDINLGTYDTSSIGAFVRNGNFFDEHFKVVANKLYFRGYQANDPNDTTSLYVSDGTAAGTQRISYLNGYGYTAYLDGVGLTVFNNTLYYYGSKNVVSAIPGGGTRYQIGVFTTNGTDAGTILIKEIPYTNYIGDNGWSDDETTPNSMRILNGKAYFLANLQLWSTDGTQAGTNQITFNPADYFDYQKRLVSQVFDNKLYFVQNAGPLSVKGIYSTTGTTSSTKFEAKSTNQNNTTAVTVGMSALPTQLKAFGNSLYFSAGYDNSPASLWRLRNPSLSIGQFKNYSNKINLFPNPATNNINLSFENNLENANIKIISILGQTVFEKQNLSGNNLSLDVASLSNGTYVIQVKDGSSISTSKFIKQ